jgi:hypothetical protein
LGSGAVVAGRSLGSGDGLTGSNPGDRHENQILSGKPGASAHIPDVPQQLIESIQLARTVRESVRDWESGKHAN